MVAGLGTAPRLKPLVHRMGVREPGWCVCVCTYAHGF